MIVDLSKEFFAALFDETAKSADFINDEIVGYAARGNLCTRFKRRAALVPDPNRALLDLNVSGTITGRTTTWATPVEVYSDQTTTFTMRKRLWLKSEGIFSTAASARATTHLKFAGAYDVFREELSPLALCEVIDQFNENRPAAEKQTSFKAERRLAKEMDDQVIPEIVRMNRAYAGRLKLYREMGVLFKGLGGETTSDYMTLRAEVGPDAPRTPPPALTASPFLAFRIHESTLNHFLQKSLAGRAFIGDQVENEVFRLLFHPEVSSASSKDPARVQFAEVEPARVAFDDEGMTIVLRFTAVDVGGRRYPGVQAATKWRVQKVDGIPILTPGIVSVSSFLPAQKLEVTKELQSFFDTRLFGLYTQMLGFRELRLADDLNKTGTLSLLVLDTTPGWLRISWKQKPAE